MQQSRNALCSTMKKMTSWRMTFTAYSEAKHSIAAAAALVAAPMVTTADFAVFQQQLR